MLITETIKMSLRDRKPQVCVCVCVRVCLRAFTDNLSVHSCLQRSKPQFPFKSMQILNKHQQKSLNARLNASVLFDLCSEYLRISLSVELSSLGFAISGCPSG